MLQKFRSLRIAKRCKFIREKIVLYLFCNTYEYPADKTPISSVFHLKYQYKKVCLWSRKSLFSFNFMQYLLQLLHSKQRTINLQAPVFTRRLQNPVLQGKKNDGPTRESPHIFSNKKLINKESKLKKKHLPKSKNKQIPNEDETKNKEDRSYFHGLIILDGSFPPPPPLPIK